MSGKKLREKSICLSFIFWNMEFKSHICHTLVRMLLWEPLRSSCFCLLKRFVQSQGSQWCTGVVAAGAELSSSPCSLLHSDKGVSCAGNAFYPGSEVKTQREEPQLHAVTLQRLKIETQAIITTQIQGGISSASLRTWGRHNEIVVLTTLLLSINQHFQLHEIPRSI